MRYAILTGLSFLSACLACAQPVLLGTIGKGSTLSTLVELDKTTGGVVRTIGPVGYVVNGMAWDPTTGTLYGSTSVNDGNHNGLIRIDLATGAGTPIGVNGWGLAGTPAVTNLTVDSGGRMYGWWDPHEDDLVSINKATGTATRVGESGVSTSMNGLAFNGSDVLYMVDGGGEAYTVDTGTGAATFTEVSLGDTAHHGVFDPASGLWYGVTDPGGASHFLVRADVIAGTRTVLPTGVPGLHTLALVFGATDFDFGDAPEANTAYPTTLARDGARHGLGGPYLGANIDPEPDGQPSADATGDDTDSDGNDEHGVTFGTLAVGDAAAVVDVFVTVPGKAVASSTVGRLAPRPTALLDAWIDFNADGDWADAGEQIFASEPLTEGANSLTFAIPQTATPGNTFTRFRVSSAGGLSPSGPASDGEVEDYQVELVEKTNLTVQKSVDDLTPLEGDTIRYTVSVTNFGVTDGTNVVLTDPLPVGVTYAGNAGNATYDPLTRTVTWSIGTLPAGAGNAVTLAIDATVDNGVGSDPITNTATVTGDQPDLVPQDNQDSIDIHPSGADLAIMKSASVSSPPEGSPVQYTLDVVSYGLADATTTQVVDKLPPGVTYVSDDVNGRYDSGTHTWTWDLGTVVEGDDLTAHLNVTVDALTTGQRLTNTATLSFDQSDPDPSDNEATADLTPVGIDVGLTKTVDDNAPVEGDSVTYTVTVTNNSGTATVSGVEVHDSLPPSLTAQSPVASVGTYEANSGLWTVGELAPQASETLTLTATVDAGAASGPQPLTNTATLQHVDQTDTNSSNDTASVDIVAHEPSVDLKLDKTADAEPAVAGQPLTYTLTVTNLSQHDATDVMVTDVLPPRVEVDLSPSGPNAEWWLEDDPVTDARKAVRRVGVVPAGQAVPVTLEVKPTIVGPFSNEASVSGRQPDPEETNNSDSVLTTVIPGDPTDLLLTANSTRVPLGTDVALGLTVVDDQGNGVPDVEITLETTLGGGSIALASLLPNTDGNGELQATLENPTLGKNTVQATVVLPESVRAAAPIQATLDIIVEFRLELGAGLQLFSLPFSGLDDPPAVLDIPAEYLRLARYNPALEPPNAWELFSPQAPFGFEQGRGYFAKFDTPRVISLGEGLAPPPRGYEPPSDLRFADRGWQLVGNPFLEPIAWDLAAILQLKGQDPPRPLAQLVRGPDSLTRAVEPYLWGFNPDAADPSDPYFLIFDPNFETDVPLALRPFATQLEVGQGAFALTNADNAGYRFTGNVGTSTGSTPLLNPTRSKAIESNWSLELIAQCGDAKDGTNVLGVMSTRAGGFQLAEPPVMERSDGTQFSLAFVPPAAESRLRTRSGAPALLAVDVRPDIGLKAEWQAVVRTNRADAPVTLSWPDLSAVPKRYRAYLVDIETGRKQAMRTTTSYRFRTRAEGATERRFRIEVDASGASRLQITNVAVVPNGRGGGMSVAYTLSQPANVQLSLKNAAGRSVYTAGPRQSTAGANVISLTGRSAAGQPLARGLYLLDLIAEADTGERFRAVRPVSMR